MKSIIKGKNELFLYLIGTILLAFSWCINENIGYIFQSVVLIFFAVIGYFYIAYKKRNYFSLNALFLGIWIATIGLSNMKLLSYQRPWSNYTWLLLGISFLVINISIEIGNNIKSKKIDKCLNWLDFSDTNNNYLFFVCSIFFLLSIFGFFMTVKICGFIPFFSTEYNSYASFYTKFLLLSHFSIINIPISYYCFYNENNKLKKLLLIIFIIVQTFIIPILSVNRGIFLIGALLLTCMIYYLGKQSFIKLLICLMVSFAGYELGSIGRHYTNEMLNASFQQQTQTIEPETPQNSNDNIIPESNDKQETSENNSANNTQTTISKEPNEYGEYVNTVSEHVYVVENVSNQVSTIKTQLPSKLLFAYSYLTVSHDNFDLYVKYNDNMSFGLRQLSGFDFILKRIFPDYNSSFNYYQVQYNLNTSNILSTSFCDFNIIGCIIFAFIFGLLCGYIENSCIRSNRIFDKLLLSIISYCVILSFFSNYTNQIIFIINILSLIFISIILNYKKIFNFFSH